MAVKVINSFAVASICGNKLLTSLALSKAKVPNPRTIIAFTPESALRALDRVGYPAILKPLIGSWGRLVVPLKDPESAKAILEDREFMYPLYQVYYIQEMVQRPPRDIRCFVIDGEAVAAMYRYSVPGEWRTNVARGGRTEPCKITPELREISIRAAEAVGEGVFGVDLVESTKGLLVLEVNYTTEFQGIVKATGVDIPGSILEYALEVAKR
jgi:[lysine-biosynthesis-protein LysW]--L-2-aminoadipate ligase